MVEHPSPVSSEGSIPSLEKRTVSEDVYLGVVQDAIRTAEESGIPWVMIGGIASAVLGRARWTLDIDFFVRPQDAKALLGAFEEAGFATQETDPHWLFKAMREEVHIDVIFQSAGGIYLDDEMLSRAEVREFNGNKVRIAPPEDLVIMKALANKEASPRYWHDALSIIAKTDLDWEYLVERSRVGPRRILSLLLYALSEDLLVPEAPIRRLYDMVTEGGQS